MKMKYLKLAAVALKFKERLLVLVFCLHVLTLELMEI